MELARSSFYYQSKAPDPAMVKGDMDILDRIEAICLDFHGYGYRRVTRQLRDDGYEINHSAASYAGERPAMPSQTQMGQDHR